MKPQQAWQAALGQLQLEMPKAAFDTWVRDTEFLVFDDTTATLTIGAKNAYARDWLADRLANSLRKLLAGILNRNVKIEFQVIDSHDAAEPDDNTPVDGDDAAEIEMVYDLPYDEIVGSGVIALPGYFAQHISDLGPTLAWLVVGFRQSAYLAGQRSGSRKHRISERQIALWSGMDRKTFRRHKQKADTWNALQGFIKLTDTKPSWIATDGSEPKMRAHAYQVQMTLPLTAAHTQVLEHWLVQNIETAGSPQAVIEQALSIPPKTLLPDQAVATSGSLRKNVLQILKDGFSGQLADAELKALAQRLQHHLMPPSDKIMLTHYFVRNLLPVLGAGPAWMLSLLRDRCFVDVNTGEQRTEVAIQGGWAEIASWLGLKQPMTIWRWLHGAKRKGVEPKAPPLSVFVHEAKGPERAASFGSGKRTFHVVLEELPPAILGQVGEFSTNTDWGATLKDIFAHLPPLGTCSRECPLCDRANTPYGIARMPPDHRVNAPYDVAHLPPNHRANAPYLSSLSTRFNLLNTHLQNLPTKDGDSENRPDLRTPGQVGRGYFSEVWDWDSIFANNPEINPQDQDHLRERDAAQFVAWLIYAHSPKSQGIAAPVMFALRRVQQGRAVPAEASLYQKYSPQDIFSFLTNYPTGGAWDRLLPKDSARRAILAQRLFGTRV